MVAEGQPSEKKQYEQVFRHLEYTMKHLDKYEENQELFETARDEALSAVQESRNMDPQVARDMSGLLNELYRKAYGQVEEKDEEFKEKEAETNQSWEEYTDELDTGHAPLQYKQSEEAYNEAWEKARETDEAAAEEHEYELDIQAIGEAWQAVRYLAPDPEAEGNDPTYQ